ncbi:MAG: enoyl-CoA hydratase/isomerase family protein [Syntrophomonadaceae bacterium]|jgi:enoyl-CoA hydratase
MIVVINRPKVLNALNSEVFAELEQAFSVMKDDEEVRVVIITGAGEKAFAAGSDVSEMSKLSLIEARKFALLVNRTQQAIAKFPKPTIAAINGYAFGGGLEVAMCCDIRIASQKAKMGQPEIKLGIIPGGGGTQRLARLIGVGRAKEMIYSGEAIDAQRAYEIGLVNQVVAHEQLLEKAINMAKSMGRNSPVTLSLAKAAVDAGLAMDLDTALKSEIELFAACFATKDGQEGLNAFVEKRKPEFCGS